MHRLVLACSLAILAGCGQETSPASGGAARPTIAQVRSPYAEYTIYDRDQKALSTRTYSGASTNTQFRDCELGSYYGPSDTLKVSFDEVASGASQLVGFHMELPHFDLTSPYGYYSDSTQKVGDFFIYFSPNGSQEYFAGVRNNRLPDCAIHYSLEKNTYTSTTSTWGPRLFLRGTFSCQGLVSSDVQPQKPEAFSVSGMFRCHITPQGEGARELVRQAEAS